MRFDHLFHFVPNLTDAVAQYESRGFHVTMGGQHPGRGTQNAATRSGPTYIELVGVHDWAAFRRQEEERQRRYPNIRFRTEELLQAGGGAAGFAVEVADIHEAVRRAQAVGLPMANPVTGRILRPDGSQAEWGMAGLTEGPYWLPFFIQYAVPPARRAQPETWRLHHLRIESVDPESTAQLLGRLLDLPVEGEVVPLPGCAIRLGRGTDERIDSVVFEQPADPTGDICGLRYLTLTQRQAIR